MIEMDILKKGGTLCFWGDWFGRPYDNFHRPVSAELDGSVLTIRFDGGEKCTVYSPSEIVNDPSDFHIVHASKIVWEWYYYGREQSPENLCRREYTFDGGTVNVTYTDSDGQNAKCFDAEEFAVELC